MILIKRIHKHEGSEEINVDDQIISNAEWGDYGECFLDSVNNFSHEEEGAEIIIKRPDGRTIKAIKL